MILGAFPKWFPNVAIFSLWILCFTCSQGSRQANFSPSSLPSLFQIPSPSLILSSVTDPFLKVPLSLCLYLQCIIIRASKHQQVFLGKPQITPDREAVGFLQIPTSPSEPAHSIPMSHLISLVEHMLYPRLSHCPHLSSQSPDFLLNLPYPSYYPSL